MKKIGEWYFHDEEKAQSFLGYAKGIQPYENDLFRKYWKAVSRLSDKRVAIDVGANYGFVTRWLCQSFDMTYASEVVPQTRECLKKNVESQGMPNVQVLDYGFSDQNKNLDVFFKPSWSGHASTIRNSASGGKSYSCPVKTIDSCNFENVDFIKIDVEGQELSVLRGALSTISKWKPMISFEVSFGDPDGLARSWNTHQFMLALNYKFILTAKRDYFYIYDEEK